MDEREESTHTEATADAVETIQVQQLYANNASVEANVYDFTLIFGLTDSSSRPTPVIAVRMSPQHAKSVALLLERFLAAYEAEVGQIQLPDSLVKRLRGEKDGPAS